MDAAALVLLVTGLGVGFGRQPMPDGSPSSEYLVQVEPEMLEALAQGASIPIVSEVPASAGPIARVRVVVGRGKLPHGQAETHLKPIVEGPSDAAAANDRIVLTQYTESVPTRYGAPVAVAAAPGRTTAPAYDPYTGVPPTVGAGGGTWNNEAPPAAGQPAGAGGTWNGAGAPAEDALPAGPLPRFRAGIQQATEPLQQGIDRVGEGVRTAAENIQGRTGRLIDELRGAEPPAAATTMTSGWNGDAAAPVVAGAPGGTGGAGATTGGWNNNAPATSGAGSAPTYIPDYGSAAPPYVPGAPATGAAADAEPWADASEPPQSNGTAAAGPGTAGMTIWPGSEPGAGTTVLQPPPLVTPPIAGGLGNPIFGNAAPATPTTGSGAPEIDADMLALPSNRALEGIGAAFGSSGLPAGQGPAGAPAAAGGATGGGSSLLGSPGWGAGGAAPATTPVAATSTPPAPSTATNPRQQAAVIFAWVTLFASAAGNIYLFWSYLDVRTKYRALVRKTARAVGSRFSAA